MEEILASIRRIIADDDSAKSPPSTAEPSAPPPPSPQPPAVNAQASALLRPVPPTTPPSGLVLRQDESAAPAVADQAAADVLELTEAMAAAAPADGFRTTDGHSELEFEDRSAEHAAAAAVPPARDAVRPSVHHEPARSLISPTTSAAVDSAFNTLAHTVLVQNARTLEDLVREMLRPMLKSWLDDNLPSLVERLVRAEIERVSRGRG
jgi:uncharacterized protein